MKNTEAPSAARFDSEYARFDTTSDEVHAPELYQPVTTVFAVDTFADIGPREVAHYHEHGCLAVRRGFSPDEVKAALAGLVGLIMGENPSFNGVWFEAKAREILPSLDAEQRQDAVRKLGAFVDFDARLKAISDHPALLKVVRTLLGDREPSMFQDMALIKPPRLGREKPWHQDKAYFEFPLATPVVGVWIALDEATVENGCMQVLPGRHKEGPIIHFQRRDWQICDNMMMGTKSAAAPLKPGGVLLFDGMLPHGTPQNSSPRRRRALQFHYAPVGVAKDAKAERLAAFGNEGKNVSC
jgi:phytanoyl-CoA hydroxylase